MKMNMTKWQGLLVAGSIGAVLAAGAGDANAQDVSANKNRFGVSSRFLFNVSARFTHAARPANPGPGVGIHAADHVYDNGYVRVDDSGNAGNQTWNWGFQDSGSLVGNTLELQTVRSPADGVTQRQSEDPQYGFEVNYGRVLGGWGKALFGVQGAFGMTDLDIKNHSTIAGLTTGVRDAYDLSGLPLAPGAPYFGGAPTPGGPLPLLLPDSPMTRRPINLAATATERARIESTLYGFKLGPFLEVPLSGSLNLQFSGGFAATLADSKFSYSETISTGGASAGKASRDEWLYGGFVDARLSLDLGKGWSVFAGVGYENVGNTSLGTAEKAVRVKLDSAIIANGGLRWDF
jgi:hypothetical protein